MFLELSKSYIKLIVITHARIINNNNIIIYSLEFYMPDLHSCIKNYHLIIKNNFL